MCIGVQIAAVRAQFIGRMGTGSKTRDRLDSRGWSRSAAGCRAEPVRRATAGAQPAISAAPSIPARGVRPGLHGDRSFGRGACL